MNPSNSTDAQVGHQSGITLPIGKKNQGSESLGISREGGI